jgi:hypothetical protein
VVGGGSRSVGFRSEEISRIGQIVRRIPGEAESFALTIGGVVKMFHFGRTKIGKLVQAAGGTGQTAAVFAWAIAGPGQNVRFSQETILFRVKTIDFSRSRVSLSTSQVGLSGRKVDFRSAPVDLSGGKVILSSPKVDFGVRIIDFGCRNRLS